jgi:hypothetical protein
LEAAKKKTGQTKGLSSFLFYFSSFRASIMYYRARGCGGITKEEGRPGVILELVNGLFAALTN